VRAAPKTIHPSRLADRDNDRPCQADLNGRHVNPTQKLSCSAVSAAGFEMMWRQPTQATAENVPVTRLTMKACVIAMARVARCFGERARLSLARATIDAIGPPTRQSRTSMRCRSRLSSLIISLTAEETIMRSIALLVGVLAIGLSSGALADEPGLNQAWCGVAFGGARECVYPTLAKCEAVMRPISGDCVPRE
jgi:hypothetical protein